MSVTSENVNCKGVREKFDYRKALLSKYCHCQGCMKCRECSVQPDEENPLIMGCRYGAFQKSGGSGTGDSRFMGNRYKQFKKSRAAGTGASGNHGLQVKEV